MWAVFTQEPAMVLIIAPGSGVWRQSQTGFMRSLGSQRRFNRAKAQRHLTTVDHLRFDADAHTATIRRDEVGRRYLAIGPALVAAYIASEKGTDNLWRDLDSVFSYRDDADRAAPYVAALVRRWGGLVVAD